MGWTPTPTPTTSSGEVSEDAYFESLLMIVMEEHPGGVTEEDAIAQALAKDKAVKAANAIIRERGWHHEQVRARMLIMVALHPNVPPVRLAKLIYKSQTRIARDNARAICWSLARLGLVRHTAPARWELAA